jgi:hypothetical protein
MFGESMPRRAALTRSLTLVAIVSVLALTIACGGGSGSSAVTGGTKASSVQVKVGDAPADSLLALEVKITNIAMQQQGGGSVNVLTAPQEIEMTHLSGTMEPLSLLQVPYGTYTGATITVSSVEVTYIPSNSTTPTRTSFNLNQTVNVSFSPALTVAQGSSVVNIDFNLAQSLITDTNGNVTGINPMFTISTASVPASGEDNEDENHGRMNDFVGQVTTLAPASGTTLASFTLTPGMSSQAQSFFVDSNTSFEDGLAQFSDIKMNMMLKVNAVTQSDGSLLAKNIELLENSDGQEAEGIVTSTTGTPTSSFQIVVHDGMGSNMSPATLGTTLTVNVGTAVFKAPLAVSEDSMLLKNLPFTPMFNATTLVAGQHVEVDSSGAMPSQSTMNATRIQLRRQALSGTVATATSGSNASFSLLLDANSAFAKLTGVTSINVYQVSQTMMMGGTVATPGTKVRVRGLLFFDGANYQFVAAKMDQP